MSDYIYPYSAFAAGVLSVDEFKSELIKLLREQPEQSDATLDHLRVLVREGLLSDKHYIDLRKATEIEAAKAAFAIAKYADLTDPDATIVHTQNVTPISSAKTPTKRNPPSQSTHGSEDETFISTPFSNAAEEDIGDWSQPLVTREEDIPPPDAGHFQIGEADATINTDTFNTDTSTLIHGSDDPTLTGAQASALLGEETATGSNLSAINPLDDAGAATVITGADATMLTQDSDPSDPPTIKTGALDPVPAHLETANRKQPFDASDPEETTPRSRELAESTRPVLKPSSSHTAFTESALPPPPSQEDRLTAVDTMLTSQHTAQRITSFLEKENIKVDRKDLFAGVSAVIVIAIVLYFSSDLMPFVEVMDPSAQDQLPPTVEKGVAIDSAVKKELELFDRSKAKDSEKLSTNENNAEKPSDKEPAISERPSISSAKNTSDETKTDYASTNSSSNSYLDQRESDFGNQQTDRETNPSESTFSDTASETIASNTPPSRPSLYQTTPGLRTPAFRVNNPTQLYRFLIAATEVGELEPLSNDTSALAYLEKLERTPGAEDFARSGRAEVARAYLELAKAAREVGRWAEAESYVEKAVELRIKQKSLTQ